MTGQAKANRRTWPEGGDQTTYLHRRPQSVQAALKRAMDIIIALALLPAAVPVIGALAALIRFESPGHPIFRQRRMGRDGVPFEILKLRTMVINAEKLGAGIYAEPNDSRFTSIGKWVRRWSLDELPQIWNVLRGDMSIVGPRPMLPVTVEENGAAYGTILLVKPGITGLAQVSGRNALPRSERLRLDMDYAMRWTLWGDISILLRTLNVALTGEGQLNTQGKSDVER